MGATPSIKKGRSRWDETPIGQTNLGATPSATPGIGATPMGMTPAATPMGAMDMPTPSPSQLPTAAQMTPEQYQVIFLSLILEIIEAQLRAGKTCKMLEQGF